MTAKPLRSSVRDTELALLAPFAVFAILVLSARVGPVIANLVDRVALPFAILVGLVFLARRFGYVALLLAVGYVPVWALLLWVFGVVVLGTSSPCDLKNESGSCSL
jgi:hypothetical protein